MTQLLDGIFAHLVYTLDLCADPHLRLIRGYVSEALVKTS